MKTVLSRDEFRNGVLARDKGRCVVCGQPAVDAHHLLERRLWVDGGYYLENGVSLCSADHLRAEETVLGVDELRAAAGITTVLLPESLEQGCVYTKWGDIIFSDGHRAPSELFYDESVQKVLAGVLHLYTPYAKYPRTPHLPWSPGRSEDDIETNVRGFEGNEVVVTAKLDGENTTMTKERLYARSPDGLPHRSQAWVRGLHGRIGYQIPKDWRLCGENLYAEHSITYSGLPSYFFLFSVWDAGACLSWDETVTWAHLLDLETVPVLYRGIWNEDAVRECQGVQAWGGESEGYVVRLAESFSVAQFRASVAKYVRAGHVTSASHWRSRPVRANQLQT